MFAHINMNFLHPKILFLSFIANIYMYIYVEVMSSVSDVSFGTPPLLLSG